MCRTRGNNLHTVNTAWTMKSKMHDGKKRENPTQRATMKFLAFKQNSQGIN